MSQPEPGTSPRLWLALPVFLDIVGEIPGGKELLARLPAGLVERLASVTGYIEFGSTYAQSGDGNRPHKMFVFNVARIVSRHHGRE